MVSQIRDLNIDEVSLVDRAAIRRKFLIIKAEDRGEELKPAENKGEPDSPLVKCAHAIVKQMLRAQADHKVDQEFLETLGCSWEEWKMLSKAEQERRKENLSARVQIESLESRLDEIADEIKERKPKLTYEQAYVAAMADPEGQDVCRRLNAALALRR